MMDACVALSSLCGGLGGRRSLCGCEAFLFRVSVSRWTSGGGGGGARTGRSRRRAETIEPWYRYTPTARRRSWRLRSPGLLYMWGERTKGVVGALLERCWGFRGRQSGSRWPLPAPAPAPPPVYRQTVVSTNQNHIHGYARLWARGLGGVVVRHWGSPTSVDENRGALPGRVCTLRVVERDAGVECLGP